VAAALAPAPAARPTIAIPVPGAAAPEMPAAVVAPAVAAPTPAAAEGLAAAEPLKEACRKAFADGHGKYKEAMAACRAATDADPRDVQILVTLADLESNRGRNQAALDWAQKALAVDPNAPDAYVFLGNAQQAAGRKNDARVAYQKYLELAPNGKYTADLRAILQSL
jgi:tetratricopeptide (TPR) repeat protein